MKRYLPFLFVVAAVSAVPVFAQVTLPKQQKTVPNLPNIQIVQPKWTPFEYQVFEIKDPTPGGGGIGLPVGPIRFDSEGRLIVGRPADPITIGNLQFQEICNEMGKMGWELIQLSPRVDSGSTKSYRAVFKRETKHATVQTTKR